eukprot:5866546-Amphidinium_carterae.1
MRTCPASPPPRNHQSPRPPSDQEQQNHVFDRQELCSFKLKRGWLTTKGGTELINFSSTMDMIARKLQDSIECANESKICERFSTFSAHASRKSSPYAAPSKSMANLDRLSQLFNRSWLQSGAKDAAFAHSS